MFLLFLAAARQRAVLAATVALAGLMPLFVYRPCHAGNGTQNKHYDEYLLPHNVFYVLQKVCRRISYAASGKKN